MKTSMIKFFNIQHDINETEKLINTFTFDNNLTIKDIKIINQNLMIVIFEG